MLKIQPWVAVVVVTALAIIVRSFLLIAHEGHLGVDGGAYLLSVNYVLGDEPTGAAFPRPPLAPGWLLVPFIEAWGIMEGYKVWSLVFSMIPLMPAFYLLARRVLMPWPAAIAFGFFSFDVAVGEMLVSGVLPLIGIGLMVLAMVAVGKPDERITRSWGLVLVASVALIPYINQTSAGKALIDLPVYVLALVYFARSPQIVKAVIPWAVLAAVIAAPSLYWYMEVMPGSDLMRFPGPMVYLSHWTDSAWIQFLLAVPAGIWVAHKATNPQLRAVGVVTVVEGILLLFLSNDETVINIFYRGRYFVMPFMTICWAWVISEYAWEPLVRESQRLAVGAVVGLWALLPWGFVFQFQNQDYYSSFMTTDMIYVASALPEGREYGVISNGFMFATWIAALNKVEVAWTFSTNPPRLYTEQYEHTRCIMGWRDDCDPISSAAEIGMDYLLIDIKFPYVNNRETNYHGAPEDTWQTVESAGWLELVRERGTARLYKIG